MAEYTSLKQSNTGWNLTWSALGRYPMVAKRRFPTLADAQAFVDDVTPGASATEGLIVTVLNDSNTKNNGVWYVKSVANNDAAYGQISAKGELIKVGGTETETAKNYSAAVELSKTLTVGQLIKVSEEETITTGEGESAVSNTFKAGFYIVEGSGVISALDTSTGAADEIGALKSRVTALETDRVKVSDFNTYTAGVTTALSGKASASDFASHATAGVDSADKALHVTLEDKTKWNNAETNAKQFASDEIAKLSTIYDAHGAAGKALEDANKYTDEEVAKAKSHADQAELDAVATANAYTDGKDSAMNTRVAALESVKDDYKAYADQAELDAVATANAHADGLNTAMDTRVAALESVKDDYKAYADQVELDAVATANAYTDGKDSAMNTRVAALESVKDDYKAYTDQAEADANSYADGLNTAMDTRVKSLEDHKDDYKTYADQAEADANSYADGLNTAMDTRVKSLESIDHDKLAADAAASAVAIVLDGAPAKFDTLKEIAEWIAEADTAEDAASLVTRVSALEAIDHNAYVAADEANLAAAKKYTDEEIVKAKAYADQAEADAIAAAKSETETQVNALANGTVKANTDAIAIINGNTEGSIAKAKADAIAAAKSETETQVSTLANGTVKANTDAIAIINGNAEGSIAKAKADAIAAAEAKIAELNVANTYETKTDASAKLEAAKAYTDEREVEINKNISAAESAAKAYTDEVVGVYSSEGVEASGLRKEIEDNEKVTAAALTELDGRVADLEAQDVYVANDVTNAINAAQAAAEAYAETYTNALFDSIKFANEDDIDGLFAVK